LQRAVIFDGRIDRSLQRPQVRDQDVGLWGQHLELMIEMCRDGSAKFILREQCSQHARLACLPDRPAMPPVRPMWRSSMGEYRDTQLDGLQSVI
jgi:hypothetical protein